MQARRWLGPLLAGLVLTGVGGGIYVSTERASSARQIAAESARQVTLRGMIGSEKAGFFADPRVAARLRTLGFSVQIEKVGSRAIATQDLKGYDFGFP